MLWAPRRSKKRYKALLEAGRISFEWIQTLGPYMGQILGSGYPMYAGSATKAPFDVLGDSFRGTTQLMMDLYRRPQKVLEAVDRLVPLMISMGVGGALANSNPLVFIPLAQRRGRLHVQRAVRKVLLAESKEGDDRLG